METATGRPRTSVTAPGTELGRRSARFACQHPREADLRLRVEAVRRVRTEFIRRRFPSPLVSAVGEELAAADFFQLKSRDYDRDPRLHDRIGGRATWAMTLASEAVVTGSTRLLSHQQRASRRSGSETRQRTPKFHRSVLLGKPVKLKTRRNHFRNTSDSTISFLFVSLVFRFACQANSTEHHLKPT